MPTTSQSDTRRRVAVRSEPSPRRRFQRCWQVRYRWRLRDRLHRAPSPSRSRKAHVRWSPKGAALGLTVVSTFTYTLESLIQAGKSLVAVDHVPACTNGKTRESRLFKSMSSYIGPQRRRDFPNLHGVRAAQGLLLDRRARPVRRDRRVERPFLWGWLVHGNRSGHLQSIILGGVLRMAAIQIFALGVLADLIASQRIVTQRTLERVRHIELELGVRPSHYQQGSSRPDGEDDDQVPRGQLDAMRS